MWDNLLHAVRQDLPEALQKHQAFGLLLALLHDGVAGPLLIERSNNLTEQVTVHYAVACQRLDGAGRRQPSGLKRADVAQTLTRGVTGFRQIVEEVRMAVALSQHSQPDYRSAKSHYNVVIFPALVSPPVSGNTMAVYRKRYVREEKCQKSAPLHRYKC